ncbi:MAG: aminotransferase class I/II-fold pyridoxal phosphate-dependent enzyme, partial [Gemmatimonadetes bacterium]|nr:aminotransferase class I/II-fold pyridoxal phosphate-dependent enzyme [Gemmatimonadota bacterium]
MARNAGVDRRGFLKTAGATAVLGAVGAKGAIASEASHVLPLGLLRADDEWDFDEVYSRFGTECIKWDRAVETYGDGVRYGMGIADMDFRAAPCITRALADRCAHENWGYLARPDSYAQAVVDWNQRRYGLEIDPESVVFTTGVHPGIIAALKTFSPPGTKVALQTPTYNGFYTDLRFTDTLTEDSEMHRVGDRYEIDWDDFELRVKRANTFILCNPQNPTGNCWTADEMTRMGEICLEHDTIVLADEIH